VYADTRWAMFDWRPSPVEVMRAKYDAQKVVPGYVKLRETCPVIGIWVRSGILMSSGLILGPTSNMTLSLCTRRAVLSLYAQDDHDFGDNNGGAWYANKTQSQQMLLDFLDEPVNR